MRRIILAACLALLPVMAFGQTISGSPVQVKKLYPPLGTAVPSNGNAGVINQEDTLQTFTIPANQFAGVGDSMRIVAAGTLGGTTDSKTINIKAGAVVLATFTTTTAAVTFWETTVDLAKVSAGNFSVTQITSLSNQGAVTLNGLPAIVDSSPIVITVTGKNATSAVAGSVNCRYLTATYVPAS